ncbi:HTH domain-containing protein [Salinibaculum rarum]|uniref:HTH domain-containing protein n=1 Tax=Salinibaculum rarum TaxID=3058903 RepID=UPI00265F49D2|nr:HTH domain-containing protein [Salinibaculum sp. KK48]
MTEQHSESVPTNPVGADAAPLTVECLVRPDLSPVSQRRIDAIYSRLQALEETAFIDSVTVSEWPPHRPAPVEDDTDTVYRQGRVDEFERWANRQNCSLKPAFRRQPVPESLLDDDEPREAIRVPVVTLSLSAVDEETLSGVVPYTVDYGTDDAETYTVDDWPSAAEATTVPEQSRDAVAGTTTESA